MEKAHNQRLDNEKEYGEGSRVKSFFIKISPCPIQ